MLTEIISAILQVLVFALIPFLVYLIQKKSVKGFLKYIGITRSNSKANYLAILASLIFILGALGLIFINDEFKQMMIDPKSITGKFRMMGFSVESVVILITIAVFKTSMAEEILFRGFVAKRLIGVLGYQKGNLLQAFLFGIMHSLLFLTITDNIFFLVFIFIVPSIGAYISAYLNEKIAGGSIIPGWISHGMANVVAYSVVGFII